MSIEFPDVPDAPGVPPVQRAPGSYDVPAPPVITQDAPAAIQAFTGPQWGIFLNGSPAIIGTSISAIEFRKGYRVATHPIEKGGFASYNKVEEPYDSRVQIACDGTNGLYGQSSIAVRAAFLEAVEKAVASLQLYDIVTPERVYRNANLVGFDVSRKSRGAISMVVCDIKLQEIRIVDSIGFSNTEKVDGADPVTNGAPQPQPPTPAQTPPAPTPAPAPAVTAPATSEVVQT